MYGKSFFGVFGKLYFGADRSPVGIEKQESSINREKAAINNVIKFIKKENIVQMRHFTRSTVEDYMESRAKMSRRTRREEFRLLKRFFKWAKKKHLISENPIEDMHAPKPQKKPPRYYTMDELESIMDEAKAPYDKIFEFLYLTGLRTGELANLEWRDYDWKNRVLTIRIVAADKKARTPGNKTKRVETIPVNDAAHEILVQRKAADDSKRFVFLNAEGNRLDNDNMYRNLKRILNKLEIVEACVHTFRHTFASHLVIQNVSIYIVRDLMRHASVKETEIYAHLSKQSTRNAANLLKGIKPSNTIEFQENRSIESILDPEGSDAEACGLIATA